MFFFDAYIRRIRFYLLNPDVTYRHRTHDLIEIINYRRSVVASEKLRFILQAEMQNDPYLASLSYYTLSQTSSIQNQAPRQSGLTNTKFWQDRFLNINHT
jgi:hypothetical protein